MADHRHATVGRAWALAAIALAAAVLAAPAARADEPGGHSATAKDRAAAIALVREGNALLDAGNAEGALDKFKQAHRLVGGDKLRFNFGQALAVIPGREPEAYGEIELFLERVASPAPDVARAARALRDRLHARLGFLHVETRADRAEVTVDGKPVGPANLAKGIPLAPGAHDIQVSAAGFVPFKGGVTLVAGQELAQVVALAPLPAAPPAAEAPPPAAAPPVAVPPATPPPALPPARAEASLVAAPAPEPAEQPTPIFKRWWFWAGVGAVAAGAVLTAVLLSGGTDVNHVCPSVASQCGSAP
jgi:hypothetical protein